MVCSLIKVTTDGFGVLSGIMTWIDRATGGNVETELYDHCWDSGGDKDYDCSVI